MFVANIRPVVFLVLMHLAYCKVPFNIAEMVLYKWGFLIFYLFIIIVLLLFSIHH